MPSCGVAGAVREIFPLHGLQRVRAVLPVLPIIVLQYWSVKWSLAGAGLQNQSERVRVPPLSPTFPKQHDSEVRDSIDAVPLFVRLYRLSYSGNTFRMLKPDLFDRTKCLRKSLGCHTSLPPESSDFNSPSTACSIKLPTISG